LDRLARDEVRLLFSFLDWRSKLALARCNRPLRGDADSPMAWQDSDGPSAFSAAGVIELNLARLTDEQTISDAVTKSLAGRRGRVRLLYDHHTSNGSDCSRFTRMPFGTFRRTAESLRRLHGLGPLCRGCSDLEEWRLLLTVASEGKRPLAELRVDDFHHQIADLTNVVSERAVQMVCCSPAMVPHLRALTLHWAWSPTDDASLNRRATVAALTQLPQLTQLECSSRLWVELIALQPHTALYGQLRSLSLFCTATPLESICQAMGNSRLEQLRVLRLCGWLDLGNPVTTNQKHWGSLLPALPRLETLALHFDLSDTICDALPCLFPAAAPAHPSLRTLQLLVRAETKNRFSRGVLEQVLSRCPQLHLALHLTSSPLQRALRAPPRSVFDGWHVHFLGWLWGTRQWGGLPRTTWTMG
jgi:hypothetical protein